MSDFVVCVYAICKNEAKFVDSWMDSMSEADLVVVSDTGSTDDTVSRLRARGAIVYLDEIKPWRFDVARNASLAHVPKQVDICVCTDLDEVFEPGWRQKLETAWKNHRQIHSGPIAKTGRYLYNWSLKADGTPDVQFHYFKVHERRGFRWKCPVHEYVDYIGALPLEKVFIEGMVLNHHPDPAKSRGSYLPLLEMAVDEAPDDDRMRYYLGREYMYKGDWQNSMDTLKFYLAMPSARWGEERSAAMRWIAKCAKELSLTGQAYAWYFRAMAEAPHMRDPLIEFAKLCYERKDWPMVFFLTHQALTIAERSKTFVNAGYCWDHTPDDLCAIAAYRIGAMEKSLEHARKALAYAPNDERMKNNLRLIQAAVKA